jgi:hypothetical protein
MPRGAPFSSLQVCAIRTLRPELVLRDVPGESLQRSRQSLRRLFALLHPSLQPPGDEVVRMRFPPRRLRLLAPRLQALLCRAHSLARSYPWIGAEPLSAEAARARSQRRGHGRSSTPCASLPLRFSTVGAYSPQTPCGAARPAPMAVRAARCSGRRWSTSGEHTRVNSRERRSSRATACSAWRASPPRVRGSEGLQERQVGPGPSVG